MSTYQVHLRFQACNDSGTPNLTFLRTMRLLLTLRSNPSAMPVQRLGQDDKAQQYAAAANRRKTAIQTLMSAPGRPGVWTDLGIVGENGDSCAGDCSS